MHNIGFYIFTTYKYHDRCSFIEETWGHDQDLYFFTDKITNKDNYIACTYDNTYHSHLFKNFYAIDYAYIKHIDKYDWFIFIGDDTYFYIDQLYDKLSINNMTYGENAIYGEVSNCWNQDKSLYYVLGGGGIIFNKLSLSNFVNNNKYSLNQLNMTGFSDVSIGIVCRDLGIKMKNMPGIYSQKPEFYGITDPQKHISFHYLKTKEDFTNLHNLSKLL